MKQKPHLHYEKGYWRANYRDWQFCGSSPTMAYNNFKLWYIYSGYKYDQAPPEI